MHSPVSMLQSLAVLSSDDVNTEAPSLENTAEYRELSWPTKLWVQWPVSILQSLAVLSPDDVKTEAPSSENTDERKNSSWTKMWVHLPAWMLQSFADSSLDA